MCVLLVVNKEGQPLIEGKLKEKQVRWKFIKRWKTRYFTLAGNQLLFRKGKSVRMEWDLLSSCTCLVTQHVRTHALMLTQIQIPHVHGLSLRKSSFIFPCLLDYDEIEYETVETPSRDKPQCPSGVSVNLAVTNLGPTMESWGGSQGQSMMLQHESLFPLITQSRNQYEQVANTEGRHCRKWAWISSEWRWGYSPMGCNSIIFPSIW